MEEMVLDETTTTSSTRKKRKAIKSEDYRWPDAKVPYYISPQFCKLISVSLESYQVNVHLN